MVYLRFFLGTVFLGLASVAALNFIVDPAGIYGVGSLDPEAYADALIKSENGLWVPEDTFDERLVVKALAKYSQRAECVVVGSSHVMQISSDRTKNRSLQDICGSVLNLGVSGAGIEDHFALAYLALQVGHPKKIILGVDPWTLAFETDSRWSTYKDDYFKARAEILREKRAAELKKRDMTDMAKLANLINWEYTIRSTQAAMRDLRRGMPTITAAHKVDPAVGGEYPVRLRDGSYLYSAKYISAASRSTIQPGGDAYKTDKILNQPEAIEAYRALLLWIKSQGVEPILLLTPYHENVWKSSKTPDTMALCATEPIVKTLAHELNVKLVGSYDPQVVGCLGNEFYDFMHPTADCLTKLRVLQ